MSTTRKSVARKSDKESAVSTRSKAAPTRRSEKSVMDSKSQLTTERGNTKHEKVDAFSNEAKAAMRQFTFQVIQNGLHSLRTKYVEVKAYIPADHSKTHFDANPTKCRYKDIPCWDRTRIVLAWPPEVPNDFIHANRVTHDLFESQQFICCQGPLEATIPDFWRCVWQEKVKQIIMLCRCQEMGKDKCAQYWPSQVGASLTFHGLVIRCDKVDSSDKSFVHTKLSLIFEKETRTVDHRQWTSWPDKSVPKTPMAPFRLLLYTRKTPKFPTIIHCSAGAGRTGTLVAIELVYKSLLRGKVPDVATLVKDIRSQRSTCVQTEDQYIYIHYAILQLLHIKNIVPAHFVRHFVKEYETYLKLLNDNGGKNLPLQATSLPTSCATCTKIGAQLNDPAKDMASSPPSESRNAGSKRDMASKVEKKGGESNNEKKANLIKLLKDKKKRDDDPNKAGSKKEGGKDVSGKEAKVEVEPKKDVEKPATSAEKLQPTPSGGPPPSSSVPPGELKPCDPNALGPVKTMDGDEPYKPVPGAPGATIIADETPADVKVNSADPIGQSPPASSPASNDKPAIPSSPSPVLPTNESAPPAAAPKKIKYEPAQTYTIQHAGDKKAIVYKRNNSRPFIKTYASDPGQPQPQILVNMNSQQPPQPSAETGVTGNGQPQPLSPSPQPQRQPGVPFPT